MAKRKKLNLKVVFDTNAIYSGSASDLMRNEIIEIISTHSSIIDIDISWYLPDTVIGERKFQMIKKGRELLPSINKLEKLLGHNLNITENIISSRVEGVIQEQLDKHSIKRIKLSTEKIDWNTIILSSLNRLPPFEDSSKEKGFRDALIFESLKLLIEDSPKTKNICRILFVTGDNLLFTAVQEYIKDKPNTTALSNLDDLVSLINVLSSEITEETINLIKDDASKIFFDKEKKGGLYYTQDVRDNLGKKFSNELNNKSSDADLREKGSWWINNPGFVKKVKQRIFWKSSIEVEYSDYKDTYVNTNIGARRLGDDVALQNNYVSILNPFIIGNIGSRSSKTLEESRYTKEKSKVSEGKIKFEVLWSVTLTTTKKLINPKVEELKYIEITSE